VIPAGAAILSTAAMQAAEAAAFAAGVSQDALMDRAGLAVAREVWRLGGDRPILVLAGVGNNGGDAYVTARYLADWGGDVRVAALGAPRDGAAARMAARWSGATVSLDRAEPRPILVDGVFGTGLSRALDPVLAARLATLCEAAATTIAIDVPSGLSADDADAFATPLHCRLTVALGALKPVHLAGPAARRSDHVVLADLGIAIPRDWTSLARPRVRAPADDANKYRRGMVLVVGGAMPGAAALAASAAIYGGAGYVLLATQAEAHGLPHAVVQRPVAHADDLAALADDDRVGAVLIGPGLGRDARGKALLAVALASGRPLVVDGDALSLLGTDAAARLRTRRNTTILTPHSGEFDRMFAGHGAKIPRTLAAARAAGTTIVHKGQQTVIADPAARAVVASDMPSWLSTAGTGDVLAGLVAARLAGGQSPMEAGATAVWLHGRAATLAGPGFAADDLIPHLSRAMAECTWTQTRS
jgi:hydroxyethylthiazole kinase-like uncharacterized protein yjeF